MTTAKERFLAKVDQTDPTGCWLWTGAISTNGYGKFRGGDGRTWNAHRWAFQHLAGHELRDGLTLDHLSRRCTRLLSRSPAPSRTLSTPSPGQAIGNALGVTRQAAWERFRDRIEARA